MRCNRCSLLRWKGLNKKRTFSEGIIQGLETAHLCCSLQWVEVPFKASMKSMILKFGQHLLWQGRGPSGCANARFNSQCTGRHPQVIMAFARGSARSRQRLSPRISWNLKVSLKRSCRMLFHSEKVRSLVWLVKTKCPFQAID